MWIRFILYGLGGWCGEALFTVIEWITGWIIANISGRCPWDYVAAGKRFAINPYIRWDFFPCGQSLAWL